MRRNHLTSAEYLRSQDLFEQGTIHALPGLTAEETVLFTSAPLKREAGPRLALRLLGALGRLDPRWRSTIAENAFTLHKTPLGGPYLLLGDRQGPSLSFSHEEGRLWAAMGSHGCVGIDVAYPEEFTGGYPFKRAFRPEELNCDRAFGHKNTARAAALIWSLKEAAVKAAGTGFNCYDPLEVRVTNPRIGGQGILFDVWAGGSISAWARAEGRGWLAVALAQRASGHCAAGSFWLQNIAKRL